jgi:hypothetical protein
LFRVALCRFKNWQPCYKNKTTFFSLKFSCVCPEPVLVKRCFCSLSIKCLPKRRLPHLWIGLRSDELCSVALQNHVIPVAADLNRRHKIARLGKVRAKTRKRRATLPRSAACAGVAATHIKDDIGRVVRGHFATVHPKHRKRDACRNVSFLNFSYVCPEPVLVKTSFLASMAQKHVSVP